MQHFSVDLLKTYRVLLFWDRQLSWWFYIFERDTQFWYTEIGNFPDDIMFLIKWRHFYTEIHKFPDDFMTWTRYTRFIWWIFCVFLVPYEKKKTVLIDTACFPWPGRTKIKKLPKIDWSKKFAMAVIWHWGASFWVCDLDGCCVPCTSCRAKYEESGCGKSDRCCHSSCYACDTHQMLLISFVC